jgi:hypothetical protein
MSNRPAYMEEKRRRREDRHGFRYVSGEPSKLYRSERFFAAAARLGFATYLLDPIRKLKDQADKDARPCEEHAEPKGDPKGN